MDMEMDAHTHTRSWGYISLLHMLVHLVLPLNFPVVTSSWTGPGPSQGPGSQFGSPTWVTGTHRLMLSPVAFCISRKQQLEAEELGLDAGISTQLPCQSFFPKKLILPGKWMLYPRCWEHSLRILPAFHRHSPGPEASCEYLISLHQ